MLLFLLHIPFTTRCSTFKALYRTISRRGDPSTYFAIPYYSNFLPEKKVNCRTWLITSLKFPRMNYSLVHIGLIYIQLNPSYIYDKYLLRQFCCNSSISCDLLKKEVCAF